jgi:hypothetical protein
MKKILLIMIAFCLTVGTLQAGTTSENRVNKGSYERLCKLFTKKAKAYKLHMRDDTYAEATLASYEKRAKLFCDKSK